MGRPSVISLLVTPGIKPCTTCKELKKFSEFYTDKDHSTGLSTQCKKCCNVASAKWRNENPHKFKLANKAWRETNKEFNRNRLKIWHKANPHKTREYQANAYERNPEKILERNSKWRSENVEQVRVYKAAYAARKRNAVGSHTAQDIKNLMKFQSGKCVYCKVSIKKDFHVDHIIALSRGGTNGRDNLQLLCPSCNLSKRAKPHEQFAKESGMLI